eukprot:110685_1
MTRSTYQSVLDMTCVVQIIGTTVHPDIRTIPVTQKSKRNVWHKQQNRKRHCQQQKGKQILEEKYVMIYCLYMFQGRSCRDVDTLHVFSSFAMLLRKQTTNIK